MAQRLTAAQFAMTYGVVEGTPHDVKIQNRGDPEQPGPEVPRSFVRVWP